MSNQILTYSAVRKLSVISNQDISFTMHIKQLFKIACFYLILANVLIASSVAI